MLNLIALKTSVFIYWICLTCLIWILLYLVGIFKSKNYVTDSVSCLFQKIRYRSFDYHHSSLRCHIFIPLDIQYLILCINSQRCILCYEFCFKIFISSLHLCIIFLKTVNYAIIVTITIILMYVSQTHIFII